MATVNPFAGSLLAKFFGRTASEGAAFAFGLATGPVLRPAVEEVVHDAWRTYPNRALDAAAAAAIVAEEVELEGWGIDEAALSGVNADRFRALVQEALNAPGFAELLALRRRGLIDDAGFEHGLAKAKLEPRWFEPIAELRHALLSPAELANARQQGFVTADRQLEEAGRQGIDADRAEIQYQLAGLPPGVETALAMLRRGIIDDATFDQIVREGHTKTKYTDDLRTMRRQVNRVLDYVQGRLRGWLTDAEMYAGAALTGYEKDEVDLLFKIHGRPLSWHQVFIGLRRGGAYDGPIGDIDDAFLRALRQSDIRPEWYNLAWAQRYTYPTAFVLRALTQSGDIPRADAERILLYQGWEPSLAARVAQRWAGGGAGGARELTKAELLAEYEGLYISEAEYRDALAQLGYEGADLDREVALGDARRAKRYRDAVIAAVHDAYLDHEVDDAAAGAELADAGVSGEAVTRLLQLWQLERRVRVRSLTPAQIVKAYKKTVLTRADATGRLADLGFTQEDAGVLLDEA